MEVTTTEAKIKAAAQKVFLEKGFSGARMQDIADKAGINKALLHYYYRSKDKLFDIIFMESFQKIIPKINLIAQSDAPLFEKIEKFVGEYIVAINADPMVPLFVLHELTRHPEKFIQKVFSATDGGPKVGKLVAQIQEEAEKGNIRPIHPATLLMNIMSLCIFPYIGKPMFQMVLSIDDKQFSTLLAQRKTEVSAFVINALRL
ncbi:TetR/AcrR family transcriptional regulator [Pontibacter sp. 172403-2]|uniref:TetR/AcrR family transcriptional regulator n=1 Tax=Pontibacter rufus TaxID=2791028 RepID=UPI0018AFE07D|nr:TetR/AcrR family transcriptional regulator [Pontibacter sp. 172403-2]MBF9254058.1 TetR/AcrR family transcriptional regulator [Pontibacter sp. 172403-2]